MPIRFGPDPSRYIQYNNGIIQNYSAPYYVTNMTILNSNTDPLYTYICSQPVGTYALFRNQSSNKVCQPGDLVGASILAYSITAGTPTEAVASGKSYAYIWRVPVGTWRCMGYARYAANPDPVSLFVRVI